MCQRLSSHMLFFTDLHLPSRPSPLCKPYPPKEKKEKQREREQQNGYDAWLASREILSQKGTYLIAGAQRQLNLANARLAYRCIVQDSAFDFVRVRVDLANFLN